MTALLILSESVKLRRSSVVRIAWIGLCMGIISGSLFLIRKQAKQTWDGINAWHTLWTTFLYPLVIALLAGLTAKREKSARGGGTWWRPYSLKELRAAEYFWLNIIILVTTALVLTASVPFGIFANLPGPVPILQLLKLALTLTLSALGLLAIQQRLAYSTGLIGSLLFGLLGTISGVVMAEHRLWWLNPWSWPIRSSLTLTGTHANGVPMALGDPGWLISPWTPILPSFIVAIVVLGLPYFTFQIKKPLFLSEPAKVLPYDKSASFLLTGYFAAELVKGRKTILPWLCILMPIMFGLIALWRHAALGTWQIWSILVLPFGSALLSAITWMPETAAWRALTTRSTSVSKLYMTKLVVTWGYANASTIILLLFLLPLKISFTTVASFYLIYITLSFALIAFHLWLAVKYKIGVTLGAGAVFTLLALIIGGTGLGQGIWQFFPWTWAWIAPRQGLAVYFSLLSVALGLAFTWKGVSDIKKGMQ
jgi:hypothetical protein